MKQKQFQILSIPFCWEKGRIKVLNMDLNPEFISDQGHFNVLTVVPGMEFSYHGPYGQEIYFKFEKDVTENANQQ